ncbi:MAG: SAM-dependent methyltransferase [Arcicella sp.]|nr:SAM-dependent methyltransferase [Arcicella sp.]
MNHPKNELAINSLSQSEKAFIKTHLNDEVTSLLLQAKKYPNLNIPELVWQIKARQKAKTKLPEWFENENIIFPKMLSVEQCSSEITAKFKASLVQGETLIDLTGGMGVDMVYMSQNFEKAIYLEQSEELCQITAYNLDQLGVKNIDFISINSIDFLENDTSNFSWIYLDPHRRDDTGNKVVSLQDCEPNILEIKDFLFTKTDNILLKASPMLDINLAVLELQNVVNIYVVAVGNEVKEILFHLQKDYQKEAQYHAVNLPNDTFTFKKSEERNAILKIGLPQQYLYEPNAAILKAGGFRIIAQHFDLQKIAPHSHLYTSIDLVSDFQGRIFKIEGVCKLDKKEISTFLSENKANITIRNFPLSVKQIREKLKISEGGNTYLFATTDAQNQKIMIVCRKVASNEL